MKKIKYSISKNKVWAEVYDTNYNIPMNFKCIYSGKNKKDCEKWLIKHNGGKNE